MNRVLHKTVKSLIDENFVYARALHYLGVEFFNYEEKTLAEVCQMNGIDKSRLLKSFYRLDTRPRLTFQEMDQYPLNLTLEYLRYAHHSYVKEYLPYIAGLVSKVDESDPCMLDLKEVFPLFVEEFIAHIYEEEDDLFGYCYALLKLEEKPVHHPINALWAFRNFDLRKMKAEHEHEDEMAPMRALVEEIPVTNSLTRVIVNEIKAFDREMLYHAEIENQILFPKALSLEEKIWAEASKIAALN